MYRGEFVLARTHLTKAYAHYEPQQHSGRDAEGDIGVAALAYLSSVLWNLGEADEAQARSDLSLELADRVGGPLAKAQAWGMRSLLHLARLEVDQFARVGRAHARAQRRAQRRLLAVALHAARGLAAPPDLERRSTPASTPTGARARRSGCRASSCCVPICVSTAGDQAGALAALEAAERHIAQTGERYSEADLYRFKARLWSDPEHAPAAARAAALLERGRSRSPSAQGAARAVANVGARDADSRRPRRRALPPRSAHDRSVTIAGGGLAGLTAAVRLAERGYRVKLYERRPMLGGNVGSRDGRLVDVYPHMYLNWYHNFWALLEDRAASGTFRPMQGIKQLAPGQYPRFTASTEPYMPWTVPRTCSAASSRPRTCTCSSTRAST